MESWASGRWLSGCSSILWHRRVTHRTSGSKWVSNGRVASLLICCVPCCARPCRSIAIQAAGTTSTCCRDSGNAIQPPGACKLKAAGGWRRSPPKAQLFEPAAKLPARVCAATGCGAMHGLCGCGGCGSVLSPCMAHAAARCSPQLLLVPPGGAESPSSSQTC